jgi:hypothetical protein
MTKIADVGRIQAEATIERYEEEIKKLHGFYV